MALTALNGADQFAPALEVNQGQKFDVSVGGTFTATVTLQRKRVGEADSAYRDVQSFTQPAEQVGESAGRWLYRLGIKPGDYTVGTANVEVSL